MKTKIILSLYLIFLITANLIVKYFGAQALWISASILIPFDFVCRCLFHEKWSGKKLMINLGSLILVSGIITIIINYNAWNIALGSLIAFTSAQITSGIFYQLNKNKSYFFKVNFSDFIAVTVDSIIFQIVAFSIVDPTITVQQIIVKFIGGLFWFYIIFKLLKIQEKF